MPNLSPVAAGEALGPIFRPTLEKKRDHYAPALNETCSLTDRIFRDKTSVEVAFQDFLYSNPLKVAEVLSAEEVLDDYREMIREHVERRVLFFFQQLIVCYQTKLHFESVGAVDQGESADAIALDIQGHLEKFATRNAAHSNTLPRLIAYDSKEWQEYQAGKRKKLTGFVFLKGTDSYRTANATINMPRWVNEADREIDEKTKDSQLRKKGENLMNLASKGDLIPDAGIVQFLEEAVEEVAAAKERLEEAEKSPEVQKVLSFYLEDLQDIQRQIEENIDFLEKFLNMRLGADATHDEEAKQIILRIRYAAIRNSQVKQAALIQKIEAVKEEILGEGRKPDHFKPAFQIALIKQARTGGDRQRLEKLFNFSPFQFFAHLETLQRGQSTKFSQTEKWLSANHQQKITSLAREIFCEMRSLRTEEADQRASITRELRGMKNWTQKELGKKVKELFPQAAASQPTISRIENCRKLVEPYIAEELSAVFQVDPGLFMPHFFYE